VIPISKTAFLATMAVFIAGCYSQPSSSQNDAKDQWTLTSSFWFGDCEFMDTVAAAVSAADIDHRRGENASIVHRNEDSAAVHRIADDVLKARRKSGWSQGTTECKASDE
jgi:PBP1b-binding outer membrane lipoprotein LpoB